jgi:hypothetical protein
VPQLVHGYPSDARSSRPQARHSIESFSSFLLSVMVLRQTVRLYRLILLMSVAREMPSSAAARVRLPA